MHTRHTLAVVLTAVMLVAAAPAGAAPSVVTSSTGVTTFTSELQSGTTIANFSANSSQETVVAFNATSTNNETAVELRNNETDRLVLTKNSPEAVTEYSSNKTQFNATINHDSLATLERSVNDNVTMEARVINDTEADDPSTTNVTFYIETDGSATVEYVATSDVGDDGVATLTDEDPPLNISTLSSVGLGEDNAELSVEDRSVDDANTTVVLAVGDGDVQDQFDDSTADTVPLFGAGGEAESGDRLWSAPVTLAGDAVPVFYEEVPDDFDDSEAYAIYTEEYGGTSTPAVVGHLSEDSDASSVDMTAFAGTGFGQMTDTYGYGSLTQAISSPLSVSGAGLLAATLPLVAVGRDGRDWETWRQRQEDE